jgi:predicted nucleotide-binding protein
VTPITETQRRLIVGLVGLVRANEIAESFTVCRAQDGKGMLVMNSSGQPTYLLDSVTPETFQAVAKAGLLVVREVEPRFGLMECTLTGAAFVAVDEQFASTNIPVVTSKSNTTPAAAAKPDASNPMNSKDVFVVHGRNESLRRSLFAFLRSVGLNPLEWDTVVASTKKGAPYVGEILDAAFAQAGAVVVLLTPDDEARLKSEFLAPTDGKEERELTGQARGNVLFDAGMAFGHHANKTILVQIGTIRPFSDVAGRHVVHLSNEISSRQRLVTRLASVGCDVDQRGTDWHGEGDFAAPEAPPSLLPAGPKQSPPPPQLNLSVLSREAQTLLTQAAADSSGEIARFVLGAGVSIQTNGKSFGEPHDARTLAVWESAIDELERERLIKAEGSEREYFKLTRRGYEIADAVSM